MECPRTISKALAIPNTSAQSFKYCFKSKQAQALSVSLPLLFMKGGDMCAS